jgi:CubicO group peptidase (beta-lactamase class C family)
MSRRVVFFLIFAAAVTLRAHAAAAGVSIAGEPAPFEVVSPEQAGYSADKLDSLATYLEASGSAAFLALHNGRVFMSWGGVETKYPIHSIRKALCSALIGIYVERGEIDLSKTLADLGIDDVPPSLTEAEKQATVLDVIQSRSGVYHVSAAEAPSMIGNRPERGSHAPGEHFYYNNWDFNVAGAILEQATGESLFDTFDREIAKPIGMQDYTPEDGFYQHEKDKSRYPAYHIRMTARDLARFGLLYMHGGRWNGEPIVPADWVAKSTETRSVLSEEWGIGYGCMWYTTTKDEGDGLAFFHTGAGVHMLCIFPKIKLVWVNRVATEQSYDFSQANLIRIWDLILGARVRAD